jgi:hypothetical protein
MDFFLYVVLNTWLYSTYSTIQSTEMSVKCWPVNIAEHLSTLEPSPTVLWNLKSHTDICLLFNFSIANNVSQQQHHRQDETRQQSATQLQNTLLDVPSLSQTHEYYFWYAKVGVTIIYFHSCCISTNDSYKFIPVFITYWKKYDPTFEW